MRKIFLASALLTSMSVAAQTPTHCDANEAVVFSCSIAKSKKVVSVCASSQQGLNEGYMQYRFGAPQKVELAYPENKVHPAGNFEVFYATPVLDDGMRGMVAGLEFSRGAIGYEISSLASGEKVEASLQVTQDGKPLATLHCVPATIVNADFSYMDILSNFGLQ